MLAPLASPDPDLMRRWLGCFLTETKENLHPEPRQEAIETDDFTRKCASHAALVRSGYARMAFCVDTTGADLLFVNGLAYELSSANRGFLRLLTGERRLVRADLVEWLRVPECVDLLCRLYHEGYFEFADA
jgi:50S ribosomal protein L16 3-hydroxylase